jgi:hypothetical protein
MDIEAMSTSTLNDHFRNVTRDIEEVDALIERGFDDTQEQWDDYSLLLERFEFRKLVTFELYESYFPPRRHEFELDLLTRLVDAVASSNALAFLGGAALGGVVGNSLYDLLKTIVARMVRRLKVAKRSREAFKEIGDNLDRIRMYFETHEVVSADQLCVDLDVERNKIEPLLKLLGFKCRRRGKRSVWAKPDRW